MAPPSSSRRVPWSSSSSSSGGGGGELSSRPRDRWQLVAMQFKGSRRRTSLEGLLFGFRQIGGQEFMGMLLPVLGSMVQRVVSEEMEKAFRRFTAPPAPPRVLAVGWNTQRPRYQLVFQTGLKTVYTMSKLEADEGTSIKVAIVETLGNTNQIQVVRSGHLSSARVEVVVLHGHFNARNDESWTPEDFDRHIVSGREKSAQLLTGNLTLKLCGGEAVLENATFTDNSSFTSTKMFRLGLRLLRLNSDLSGEEEERVLEGVTKPFRVKERRVEGFEKHYPPMPDDEVWRLEKIRKNGPYHQALAKEGIDSVRKFLRACMTDEQKVLKIFSKMSQSTWKSIIGHALTCKFGDGLYLHEVKDPDAGLFFDEIHRLVGVQFGGCYKPIDQLNQVEKNLAESLKREAYRSMGDLQYNYRMVNNQPVPVLQTFPAQGTTSMFPAFPALHHSYLGGPSNALGFESRPSTSNVGLGTTSFVQGQTSHDVQLRHQLTTDGVLPYPTITQLQIPQTQTTYLDPDGCSAAVPCNGLVSQASDQLDPYRQDQASNFSYSCHLHNGSSSLNDVMSLTQPHSPLPTENGSFINHFVELRNGLPVIQSQQAVTGFHPSRTNSFDMSCDEALQRFMSQISNGEGASTPLSPRKWFKIRVALKLIYVGRLSRRYRSGPYCAPPRPRLVPTI